MYPRSSRSTNEDERDRRGTGSANPKSPIARKSSCAIVGEQDCHPVDDECLDYTHDEPSAQSHDIEIAVQVSGKADKRATVVVPISVEQPIDRVVYRFSHGLCEQHEDRGREKSDDPVSRIRPVGNANSASLSIAKYSTVLAARNAAYPSPRLMMTSTSRSR